MQYAALKMQWWMRCGDYMFNESNSTVFILGAGASWHYGYPTGDTLAAKVIEKAAIAGRYIQHSLDFPHTEIPEFLAHGYERGEATCCLRISTHSPSIATVP